MNTRPLLAVIALLASFLAHADPEGLEMAKASAQKVSESTCPLVRLVSRYGKAKPDSPEAQYLQMQIEEESKRVQQLKAEEAERLRQLHLNLTIKEGRELNEYIDGPLAKTCDVQKY